MSTIKVAINGFGRIGRAFFKLAESRPEIEIVAINDLGSVHNMAYLLRYDTVYGQSGYEISINDEETHMVVDGHDILMVKEPDPSKLPWGELEIDVVVESTGVFTDYAKANGHLEAGAKKVVITAPAKGEPVEGVTAKTVLMGVNHNELKTCQISSNGSCTTNAGSPVMSVLSETVGVEKAMLNTIHGYTATQAIVDGPDKKDPRRGRAAAQNIIPSTTGAAIATAKAITSLENKFDGIATRVPVVCGSIADLTFVASKNTTPEEINEILKKAANNDRWKGIFTITEDPIVSSDIIGNTHASIADLSMTRVVDGNLVKVMAWYDNEMGYTNTLVEHVIETGKSG